MDFNNTRYIPMSRRRRIYERKAKGLYNVPEPGTLIQYFNDDPTTFNAKKPQLIEGKSGVNDFVTGLFLGIGIRLVDFKMECGRLFENEMMGIIVADEISPDACRLWDIKSNEKLDKDRFRRGLGGLLEAYTEVAKRLGILMENERPAGSGPVLVKS